MKSASVTVTAKGDGITEALAITERFAAERGLDKKPALHLRLLAEELFGLIRGIAGEVEASYWLEAEGKNIEMHMKSEVDMTQEIKDQFIAASSSGKNEATRSFMGKIRNMIAGAVLSTKEALPYAMMNTAYAYPMGVIVDETASVWSMSFYKDDVQKHLDDNEKATEAWDELEKSIVANVADDIKVKIIGKAVEITVLKAF